MADETPRVATAYILIKARDAGSREDIRRIGQQYGEDAGKAAGVAMAANTAKSFDKEIDRHRDVFRRAGERMGRQFGEAAGGEAARSMGERLRRDATRITVTASDIGDRFGGALGQRASDRASLSLGAGLRRQLSSSPQFRSLGARLGDDMGRSIGTSAGLSILDGMRRELTSGITRVTASVSDLPGLAIGAGDAGGKAGRSFTAGFGARVRDLFSGSDAGGVFTITGVGAGRKFSTGFGRGLTGARSIVKTFGDGAGKILESSIAGGIGKGVKGGLIGVTAIGGGASALALLGPAAVGATAAVVDLSGALGLLPAGLSAIAAAVGTARVGLLGVGEAISASAEDAEKYKAALDQISPSGQRFVKAVVAQKDAAKQLQATVQDRLFAGLGKDVRDLSDRYLPILQRKMVGIAGVFNGAAKDVAGFFDTPQTAGQLERILARDTQAMRNLRGAAVPVVAALLDIADVGSSFLPGLADEATESITRFSKKVQDAAADGRLEEYFRDGVEAAGDLASAVGGAGRIISGVFAAGNSASSSPLETLAGGLNAVADVVNAPGFQAGLRDIFDAIAQGGQAVFAVLPEVGDALVALEPAFAAIVRGSGEGLASTLSTVASLAVAAAPTITALAGAYEAAAPYIGPVVVGLVALKGALAGLAAVEKGLAFITLLPGRITAVGASATAARASVATLSASLVTLGAGLAVVGAAAGADALGDFIGKAYVSKVGADDLTKSLESLGRGGELGASGLKLFENKGLFGLITNGADDTSQALDRFETAAAGAFGDSLSNKLGRIQSFGDSLGRVKEIADQLDPALASLAKSDPSAAAAAFGKFIDAGKRGGASVSELTALFPQYASAAKAAGDATASAAGQTQGLSMSLETLSKRTAEYASAALGARGSAREYEAAIDAAADAVRANGKSLDITTSKGRTNAAALDQIAASGIALARSTAGEGVGSQERFRSALQQTRSDLIAAARRFGLTRQEARDYANQVLKIPSRAETLVSAPGLEQAKSRAELYAEAIRAIPRRKETTLLTTIIERKRYETGRGSPRNSMVGGIIDRDYPTRRFSGGMIDPRLGAPRQDNVRLLVSGGEFVMNAWAVKQPGVEALLRYINTANRLPDSLRKATGFADGGKVAAAGSAGMFDLTNSKAQRIERTISVQSATQSVPAGGMSDDQFERMMRRLDRIANRPVVVSVDGQALAGAVVRNGGGAW
ncbi:hypothetical protein [Kineosporia sp. NBRC 101731]|uniref:hypothetical protein n=1 Tax=Kineosporia sp. NBRC 101731 TaxID=3032199 RepID=UPI0024A5546E|nr:hypothetical protein [Kineosporia sp. NBRC 101731]GLY32137.1 hypothetical protein Kisp02_55020 [Kineosporia sp. NBRC 101731]